MVNFSLSACVFKNRNVHLRHINLMQHDELVPLQGIMVSRML